MPTEIVSIGLKSKVGEGRDRFPITKLKNVPEREMEASH
jgi:hypothetical protein